MTTSTHDETPQRTATRAPVGKPINLQFDDATEVAVGSCRNISIGGMFVEVQAAPSHGSLVRFELVLDDDNSIRGLAEVVWVRTRSFGVDNEAGIGIKFRFLEQRDRQMIFKLVSAFIKERLANRPPMTLDPVAPPPAQGILRPPDPLPGEAQDAPDPPTVEVPIVGSSSSRQPQWVEDPPEPRQTDLSEPADPVQPLGHEPFFDGPQPMSRSGAAAPSGGVSELDAAPIDLQAREAEPVWQPDPELTGPIASPYSAIEDSGTSFDDAVGAEQAFPPPRRVSRRPKTRSSLMPLLVLGIVLAIIVFTMRDRLFGPPPPMDEPLPAQIEPTPDSGAGSVGRRASGTESSGSANQPQVGSERPVDATEPSNPSAANSSAATTGSVPVGSAPVPSPPPPSPPPSSSPAVAQRQFTQVLNVEWQQVGEGLEITVTTDGVVPESRLASFRLNGDSPREVIQLLDVNIGYGSSTLGVGGPAVRQIRTGLNDRRGGRGKELRLVLDLTGPSARLADLRADGNRVIARLEVD